MDKLARVALRAAPVDSLVEKFSALAPLCYDSAQHDSAAASAAADVSPKEASVLQPPWRSARAAAAHRALVATAPVRRDALLFAEKGEAPSILNTPLEMTLPRCGHRHLLVPYGPQQGGPSLSAAASQKRRIEARTELSHLRTFTQRLGALAPEPAQDRIFELFGPLRGLDSDLEKVSLGKKGHFFDHDLCARLSWLTDFVISTRQLPERANTLLRSVKALSELSFDPNNVASTAAILAMLCALPTPISKALIRPGVKLHILPGDSCLMFGADDIMHLSALSMDCIAPAVRRFIFSVPKAIFTEPLAQSDLRVRAQVTVNLSALSKEKQSDLFRTSYELVNCLAKHDAEFFLSDLPIVYRGRLQNDHFTTLEVLARKLPGAKETARFNSVLLALYERHVRAPVPIAKILTILLDISPLIWPQLFRNAADCCEAATRGISGEMMRERSDLQDRYAGLFLKRLRVESEKALKA